MSEDRSDLLVSGMKLRSKKNLDWEKGRNAEAGAANMTPTDSFEEGEQMLSRPDCHHHQDLEGSGEEF